MPSVLPATRLPAVRVQRRARISRAWAVRWRIRSKIIASVNSATGWATASGVLRIAMPRAAAAAKSMLSMPTPTRLMTRKRGNAARTSAV